jgi:monooxygenase
MSGLGLGYYLGKNCAGSSYAILESRLDLGGTWDLFQYPGIRSDSDMYTFGFAFNPWLGNKAISEGGEIMKYMHSTAERFDIKRRILFGHSVNRAAWDSGSNTWTLQAERRGGSGSSAGPVKIVCRHLCFCTGYYDYKNGYSPAFPQSDSFKGQVIHPQHWPADYDPAGKRIVVIGSGATAVTLIPNLAGKAEHVTMLQRSPTYVAALPARDEWANFILKTLPKQFAFNLIRWFYIFRQQALFRFARIFPTLVKKDVLANCKAHLGDDFDLSHFSPTYAPWDQRFCVCPDGDFFKCLKEKTASVVTDHIAHFTPAGILLKSGKELVADTIVTATGLNVKVCSYFCIINTTSFII